MRRSSFPIEETMSILSVSASLLLDPDTYSEHDPGTAALTSIMSQHDILCLRLPQLTTWPLEMGQTWCLQYAPSFSDERISTALVMQRKILTCPYSCVEYHSEIGVCFRPRTNSWAKTLSLGVPAGVLGAPWNDTLVIATHIKPVDRTGQCKRILAWIRQQRRRFPQLRHVIILGQIHYLLPDDLMPFRRNSLRSIYESLQPRLRDFPLYHTGMDILVSSDLQFVDARLSWGDESRYPTISATLVHP